MRTKSYPTDLTDAQWELMAPFFPASKTEGRTGRPREYSLREIINGIFYVLRTGCTWDMMPHDLPTKAICYHYFRLWRDDGAWQKCHDTLREQVRKKLDREPTPSAAVLDSQSVKMTEKGVSSEKTIGYDTGKRIKGRKRHLLVDTEGLLLEVVVHSAGIQDRDGAKLGLAQCKERFPRLKCIWADGGYAGRLLTWVKAQRDW